MSSKKNFKIVVGGNATLDVFVLENARSSITIEDKKVRIVAENGEIVEFRVEDPPIKAGRKHRVNQNIAEAVKPLWHRFEPGGGGYNSVVAMRKLPWIGSDLALTYIDVSIPAPLIVEGLKGCDIDSHFFYQRGIPINLIIGCREDKIILKGPQLGRVEPVEKNIREAEKCMYKSNALLINSWKDPRYVEEYIKITQKYGVPVYCTITSSMDKEFTLEYILPRVRAILNYDEMPELFGGNSDLDEKSRLEFALETLIKIRKDSINTDKPLFVTLGRHGAYCARKSIIDHVQLKPEYRERVAKNLNTSNGTRGAGDVFSAAVVGYDTAAKQRMDLVKLLKKANSVAIRHIGYTDFLPEEVFDHKQIPIKKS